MVDTTASESNGMYDERTTAWSAIDNANDCDAISSTESAVSFRLEIVAISGREGAKLQAIQARAIRDALLWAIEQQARDDNPGEGK